MPLPCRQTYGCDGSFETAQILSPPFRDHVYTLVFPRSNRNRKARHMNSTVTALAPDWPRLVRPALIHIASLTHQAIIYSRSWAADSPLARVRLAAKLERAVNETALLNEEIRIKTARMARIPAKHRPFYPATERMAILELKAAGGWNLAQTARAFMIEPETVASWISRIDEASADALVCLSEPPNKFPDFVRHVVRRMKALCPTMGRKRIADLLGRAGLRLAATTVGRILKAPSSSPDRNSPLSRVQGFDFRLHPSRIVTARHPNHVWHVDLTVVPTSAGFWASWFPHALPQVWPFCWWVALVVDHFSRKCVGFAVFNKQPTSLDVRTFLGRSIKATGVAPRHLISDKGSQFHCKDFRQWCKRRKINPRYGAVGKYGSIAIIERFIRSLKSEHTRRIFVPYRLVDFRADLACYIDWYNEFRPHQSLNGRTPQDVYAGVDPPDVIRSQLNSELLALELNVAYCDGRRHLPIVQLRKAA